MVTEDVIGEKDCAALIRLGQPDGAIVGPTMGAIEIVMTVELPVEQAHQVFIAEGGEMIQALDFDRLDERFDPAKSITQP